MWRFLAHRVWQGAISIVGASIIIFLISRLSGDPVLILLPNDASPALIAETRQVHGRLSRTETAARQPFRSGVVELRHSDEKPPERDRKFPRSTFVPLWFNRIEPPDF